MLDFPIEAKEFFRNAYRRFKDHIHLMGNDTLTLLNFDKSTNSSNINNIWNDDVLVMLSNLYGK